MASPPSARPPSAGAPPHIRQLLSTAPNVERAEVIAPPTQGTPLAAVLPPSATSEPPVPIAEKVIGAGLVAVPNAFTAQQAGMEVNGIAGAINVCIEWAKNQEWFPEASLTIPVMIAMAFGVAWFLWQQNPVEFLARGSWIITQAHANFIGGKRLGLLAPAAPEKKFAAVHPNARLGPIKIA